MAAYASLLAAQGQQVQEEPPGRIAPFSELVNAFEFEAMARRKLAPELFAAIAGSDRAAFDRITLRPRMMVNTMQLDLSVELLGAKMHAPMLAGPASQQSRFHPDGELATVRGATAAKTAMVVAGVSSVPLDRIAAEPGGALWYQTGAADDLNAARARVLDAVRLGCKAVCLTVGGGPALDWAAIDKLRSGIAVPFLLKGILSVEEARAAAGRGVDGIVVSNYRERGGSAGLAAPIEVLPAIAEAVGGKIPILIDGGFRRGSDILKALALGAKAVMLGRPPLWGLAAYGAAGVQRILEMLQEELGRDMAMCGLPNVAAIDAKAVRIHRR